MIPFETVGETINATGFIGWLVGAAAAITACGVIYKKLLKPLAAAIRAIHATYDRVDKYDDRIKRIEDRSKELVNNSGSSLRDAVDRIEAAQAAQTEALNTHIEWGKEELLKVWQELAKRGAA